MITKKDRENMTEEKLRTEYRNGDFVSNVLCPKCKKVIASEDLKHWKCSKCKADFRVVFVKPQKKDSVYFGTVSKTGKFKIKWRGWKRK